MGLRDLGEGSAGRMSPGRGGMDHLHRAASRSQRVEQHLFVPGAGTFYPTPQDVFFSPTNHAEVLASLKRILERRRLQRLTGLIGESDGVREVMVQVEQMAPVTATVLIEGESGTGKELVARALHLLGARKAREIAAKHRDGSCRVFAAAEARACQDEANARAWNI